MALVITLILIPACCFHNIVTKKSSFLIGMFQVVSGKKRCRIFSTFLALGVALGCILFAFGWDNNELKDACGAQVGKLMLGK